MMPDESQGLITDSMLEGDSQLIGGGDHDQSRLESHLDGESSQGSICPNTGEKIRRMPPVQLRENSPTVEAKDLRLDLDKIP